MNTSMIKNIKIPFILLSIVWVPVIFCQRYYVDDLGRSVRGYYSWASNGRPLTEVIFRAFNYGGNVIDYSPAYQIIALIIMSASCVMFVKALDVEISKVSITASALLFLSPLYMENFSYRFDSLSMSISCFLAIMSFALSSNIKNNKYFLLSIILGIAYLSTYQSFISIFIALSIAHALRSTSIRDCLLRVAPPILSLFSSYFIYSYFVASFFVTGEYNIVHSIITLNPLVMVYNMKSILLFSSQFFSGINGFLFAAIVSINIAFFLADTIRKSGFIEALWKSILILILLISPTLAFLPLQNPVYSPRVFVGFGAVMAILSLINIKNHIFSKFILITTLLYCSSVFFISVAYMNASNALYRSENYELTDIVYKSNISDKKNVIIFGKLEKPLITKNISKKIKLIDYMTLIYVNNDSWWGNLQLEMYGIQKNIISKKAEREAVAKKMCNSGMNEKGFYEIDDYFVINLSGISCN